MPDLFRNLYEEPNPYTAITLALEHLDVLTYHVGERLRELSSDESADNGGKS